MVVVASVVSFGEELSIHEVALVVDRLVVVLLVVLEGAVTQ